MNKLARMLSDEERNEIIEAAVEKALLLIPEVIGNLLAEHGAKVAASRKFYEQYPKFKDHREVVASVMKGLEDSNGQLDPEAMFKKAVPLIEKRISQVVKLNLNDVQPPKLDFGELTNGSTT